MQCVPTFIRILWTLIKIWDSKVAKFSKEMYAKGPINTTFGMINKVVRLIFGLNAKIGKV